MRTERKAAAQLPAYVEQLVDKSDHAEGSCWRW